MGDWSHVWNKRPGVLFGKRGMLVLDEFKSNLTVDVISVIQAILTMCGCYLEV
jgi:hypothetical protein